VSARSLQKRRLELAHAAARLIAVDGINDFLAAKKKAAEQLGLPVNRHLPTNVEVEQALVEYQTLFQSEASAGHVYQRRRVAVGAMRLLQDFAPVLVGPVLNGTATHQSPVDLHVFTDEPEQIRFLLEEYGIPSQLLDKTLRHANNETIEYPVYHFRAEDIPVNLVVMPLRRRHSAPLSPVDGKPMERAALGKVMDLINE
jgi:hypothetical protein